MINYNKNKLICKCLYEYYATFSQTLDTANFVPAKYNDKILAYIFKNMKRQFKKVDREDKRYQREQRKKLHKGRCVPRKTAENAARAEDTAEKSEVSSELEENITNPATASGGDTRASL